MPANEQNIMCMIQQLDDTKKCRSTIFKAMLFIQEKQYHEECTDKLKSIYPLELRNKIEAYYQSCILDWQSKINEYKELESSFARILDTLPDKQRNVLYMLYIDGLTAEEVAEKLVYTTGNIFKIRRDAIAMLEKKYPANIDQVFQQE